MLQLWETDEHQICETVWGQQVKMDQYTFVWSFPHLGIFLPLPFHS
jgi:hypothetical protein